MCAVRLHLQAYLEQILSRMQGLMELSSPHNGLKQCLSAEDQQFMYETAGVLIVQSQFTPEVREQFLSMHWYQIAYCRNWSPYFIFTTAPCCIKCISCFCCIFRHVLPSGEHNWVSVYILPSHGKNLGWSGIHRGIHQNLITSFWSNVQPLEKNWIIVIRLSGFLQVKENWKKSGNSSGQVKIFFGKVRENEKLVPRDVRFSG